MSRHLVPVKPRSRAIIESLALDIIKQYQPGVFNNGEQFNVENFFECKLTTLTGVDYDYQQLGFGIYGYTDSDAMVSVISSDIMDEPGQEYFCRSTIAHEIGHAILHVQDYKRVKAVLKSINDKDHILKTYREEELKPFMNPEWQAWRFAGALLMPALAVKEAFGRGCGIKEMSKRFGVNPVFVESRLKALRKMNYQ